ATARGAALGLPRRPVRSALARADRPRAVRATRLPRSGRRTGAMTTLLGLVETPGQYQELIRLAELLKAQARLSQLYLVHDCGPATQQILEGFARAGAECIAAEGQAVSE